MVMDHDTILYIYKEAPYVATNNYDRLQVCDLKEQNDGLLR